MPTLPPDLRHHEAIGERKWEHDDVRNYAPMGYDDSAEKPVLWLRVQSDKEEDRHAVTLVYEPPGAYDPDVYPGLALERTPAYLLDRGFDGGPMSCAYEVAQHRAGVPPDGDARGGLLTADNLRELIETLEAAQVRETIRRE